MAKSTFTNEQLCRVWAKQAKAGGTRGDVVRELLALAGLDNNEDNYRKMYNNVTQRHKQLAIHATHPVKFPELTVGKKAAKRSVEQMTNLQNIVNATLNGELVNGEGDIDEEVDAVPPAADTDEDEDVDDEDDVEDDEDDDPDNVEPAF